MYNKGNHEARSKMKLLCLKEGSDEIENTGAGLRVHLGSGHYGTVPLPETHDAWVSNALEAVAEGSFVRSAV